VVLTAERTVPIRQPCILAYIGGDFSISIDPPRRATALERRPICERSGTSAGHWPEPRIGFHER